jgi:diguanylate cyclase
VRKGLTMGRQASADGKESGTGSKLIAWIFPPVPASIRGALLQAQFESVQRQVPMLLAVAALNVIIVMAVCAHDGFPMRTYLWMAGLVFYCAARGVFLHRQMSVPISPDKVPRMLMINVALALGMITALGIAISTTFVIGTFSHETMIPVSLAFGATSIAHCLYTLRPAAIGTLVMGMVPQSVVLILFGNFQAIMLGIATLTVAALMVRFVAAQYDQLIASLCLEKRNHDLANTDALTGLANRRAVMAMLETEKSMPRADGLSFGVALLDLDGFKRVNDTMGHHAGDLLLQEVGSRLVSAARASDAVGRLGGDEFIILFRNVYGDSDVSARATAMLVTLCVPAALLGTRVSVAASLGHAIFPRDGDSVDDLLIAADKALYASKDVNKAGVKPETRVAA